GNGSVTIRHTGGTGPGAPGQPEYDRSVMSDLQREPTVSSVSEQVIHVDGAERTVTEGTTGTDLFGEDRAVVAIRVDGQLKDLATDVSGLPAGAVVEKVDIASEDGLSILRHSAAHVLAQAVQQVRS